MRIVQAVRNFRYRIICHFAIFKTCFIKRLQKSFCGRQNPPSLVPLSPCSKPPQFGRGLFKLVEVEYDIMFFLRPKGKPHQYIHPRHVQLPCSWNKYCAPFFQATCITKTQLEFPERPTKKAYFFTVIPLKQAAPGFIHPNLNVKKLIGSNQSTCMMIAMP